MTRALDLISSLSLKPKEENLTNGQNPGVDLLPLLPVGKDKVATKNSRDSAELATFATFATQNGDSVSELSALRKSSTPAQRVVVRETSILFASGKTGRSGKGSANLWAAPLPLQNPKWQKWQNVRVEQISVSALLEQVAERAAILEADANLSRSDADRQAFDEAVAQMPGISLELVIAAVGWITSGCPLADALATVAVQDMARPHDRPLPRWCALQGDTLRFADQWAEKASKAGWQTWEIWGCHRRAPFRRINGLGLVAVIGGATLTDIDEREATTTTLRGPGLRYRRKMVDPLSPGERAMIWEITGKETIR